MLPNALSLEEQATFFLLPFHDHYSNYNYRPNERTAMTMQELQLLLQDARHLNRRVYQPSVSFTFLDPVRSHPPVLPLFR